MQSSAQCGFACHWDSTATPTDFYTVARANSIQLRYDVVQSAATQVLTAMETKEANTGVPQQFRSGIYMFQNTLTRVYPATGEASNDLTAAVTALSTIEPVATTNSPDTNFAASVVTLTDGSYLTAQASSGAGSTAATPKKNIFIITDGIEDYCTSSCNASGSGGSSNNNSGWVTPQQNGTRIQQPIQAADCQPLKNLNFNVWVLYTTYTPLTSNGWYNSWIAPFTTATPTQIATSLQNCASASTQMYEANSPTDIATAMQDMLVAAEASPARLTQ